MHKAAADAEPRAGGSEQAPGTQAPTHSLTHTRGALGECWWRAGLCVHTRPCARVCSRVGTKMLCDLHKFGWSVGAHANTRTR